MKVKKKTTDSDPTLGGTEVGGHGSPQKNVGKKEVYPASSLEFDDIGTDSEGRTYPEVVGPYKKGSMVVKLKKKKSVDSESHNDLKMYGELTPKEAGVVLDIYEENGRFSDTKSAQSLKNKGYITVSKVPSGSTPGEGVLTSKGEQWVKDFHGGKFDSKET